MQVAISIEPYLVVEKVRLIQYLENIIEISRKLGQAKVCLHFDYFKPNADIFNLVHSYCDKIEIDLHLMQEAVPSVMGFRSVSFNVQDVQKALHEQNSAKEDLLTANIKAVDKARRGLVLDLGCKIDGYEDLIREAQYMIVMTVKCGKSGQTFQPSALQLVKQIRRLNPKAVITVDGGVNENNILLLKEAGVDVVVVGSYAQKCYENGDLATGINRLLRV